LSDTTQPRSRQAFVDDGFGGALLPPDLLAFPRFPQSPSIQSSISNIHDARIYGRSPLTSPVYGDMPPSNGFRTLQHPKTSARLAIASQRSNSPFLPGPIIYPQQVMKQGYVTIPRKPRTGSWAPSIVSEFSVATSPGSPPSSLDIAEPVYDNLGLRTTAAGNSVLNLNKLGGTSKAAATSPGANLKYSMKDRPLPATPATSINGDHHHAPASLNGSVPREPLYNSASNNTNNNSNTAGATLERKVPPRPPPKPKKKALDGSFNDSVASQHQQHQQPQQQRITNGNHFEDEGEDGTEV